MKLVYGIVCTLTVVISFFSTAKASEENMYAFKWLDEDKEIHVLQNRVYQKKNHLHAGVSVGKTLSGAFVDATGFQGRLGYFFTETLGIEGVYAKNSSKTNNVYDQVRNLRVIPFAREVTGYSGGMLLWSPFYAKMNVFNLVLYYDWIFGLGLGNLNEENNQKALKNKTDSTMTAETHSGLMWDASFRFYLTQTFSMRLGVNAIHYKANPWSTDGEGAPITYSNYDLLLGLYLNL